GRFLCPICDVEFGHRHLCPACLEAGKKKGKIAQLDNRRALYDSTALALGVLPVLIPVFIYFTIITAPMTLYFVIRYWNAPSSVIPRWKWRFVVAAIFAIAQLAGWTWLFSRIIA
ncbi:MAG: hypothetical protein M3463_20455, partial [Verrucomicrobiota bacterium]|nr:hypothetical protein [Verrucomicrobiota bacterium]